MNLYTEEIERLYKENDQQKQLIKLLETQLNEACGVLEAISVDKYARQGTFKYADGSIGEMVDKCLKSMNYDSYS